MRYFFVLVVLINITACAPFPYKENSSPYLTGQVVDGNSGEPIVGARVELYQWKEEKVSLFVETNTQGFFNIDKTERWKAVFWLLGGDPVMYGKIKIIHNQYKPLSSEYFLSTGELFEEGGPKFEFGTLKLVRSAAPNKASQPTPKNGAAEL